MADSAPTLRATEKVQKDLRTSEDPWNGTREITCTANRVTSNSCETFAKEGLCALYSLLQSPPLFGTTRLTLRLPTLREEAALVGPQLPQSAIYAP